MFSGNITGYSVIEVCPQPSWVALNKPELTDVSVELFNNLFNTTISNAMSFEKDNITYYIIYITSGSRIKECTTNLEQVCGCQEINYETLI